jgi:hypothetical protein
VSGFTLGQSYGHGRTFQRTIIPGAAGAAVAPGAGVGYTFVVGPWDWMRLVFCAFTITTDATAGNRYLTIEYPGATGASDYADGAAVLVGPSTVNQRFIGCIERGTAEWNTGTDVFMPLGGIWLAAGRQVKITNTGAGAGDQLTNIRLTFDATVVDADGSETQRLLEHAIDDEAELAQLARVAGA